MSFDLSPLHPIIVDAIEHGAAHAAEKHGVPKSYVAAMVGLVRKLGVVPSGRSNSGARRAYDIAELLESFRSEPIDIVSAKFGISPSTILRIVAKHSKDAAA